MPVGVGGMKLGDAYVAVGARIGEFTAKMNSVEARLMRVGSRMQTMGQQMSLVLSAPLAIVGGASVKAFSDFDSAMTQSTAIMGNLSETMQRKLEEQAKRMAREVTFSAKDMAASYFYLASAGLSASESLKALPVVARFAQAGMFDMATATDLLTDAQSALGMTIRGDAIANMENMARLSDVLVKANTLANATVQQFSEALTTKSGPVLKSFNKTAEEGVAVLAALADQGIKASHAGTMFSIVMNRLSTASVDNKEAYQQYGVQVYDMQGKFRNMADIMRDFERALGPASDEMKTLMLNQMGFTSRSVSFLKALLGTSSSIRRYEEELKSAGGTTQEVVEKQLRSFSAQMLLLRNRINLAGIELGEHLAPIIRRVGDLIANLTDRFSRLSEGVQATVARILVTLAALGPALIILGTLVKLVAYAIRGLKMLGVVIEAAFSGPWIAAAAAIAGVAALIVNLAYEGETFGERWKAMTDETTSYWKERWQQLSAWWNEHKDKIGDAFFVIGLRMKQAFNIVVTIITLMFANIGKYIAYFAAQAWQDLVWFTTNLPEIFIASIAVIVQAFNNMGVYLEELFSAIWHKITHPQDDFMAPDFSKIKEGLADIWKANVSPRTFVDRPEYFAVNATAARMAEEAEAEMDRLLSERQRKREQAARRERRTHERGVQQYQRGERRKRQAIRQTTDAMREGFYAADEFARQLQERLLNAEGPAGGPRNAQAARSMGSMASGASGDPAAVQAQSQARIEQAVVAIARMVRALGQREPVGVFGAAV